MYANFGQITDADLKEARLGITSQYDFATQTVPAYLHLIRRCQQLHGNAIPPRPISDNEAMGIVYLNLQRSGTFPLDCREWEMLDPNLRTFAQLQTRFILAERRMRASRTNGIPAGLVNNLQPSRAPASNGWSHGRNSPGERGRSTSKAGRGDPLRSGQHPANADGRGDPTKRCHHQCCSTAAAALSGRSANA